MVRPLDTPNPSVPRAEATPPTLSSDNLFGFILGHSRRRQALICLLTLLSLPFQFAGLELPKQIVNSVIADGGAKAAGFPRPLLGLEFGRTEFLFLLCGGFLLLVLVNGGFKFAINVLKGRTGEGLLLKLRRALYANLLRFPLPRFQQVAPGEVVAMINGETEPMGNFFADAVAQPLFQGGTLLVNLGFIFLQNPFLGLAAVSLYPLQAWLVPRLQAQVNALDRRRIVNQRKLANEIAETIHGATEIHGNGTALWHAAEIAARLGKTFRLRFTIFRKSYFIDFLNEAINQTTPFLFFTVGGWFAIQGDLSMGSLVSVLAAYKDLPGPWRELLDWYQTKEDIRIKFEQVVHQFQPPDLLPPDVLKVEPPADAEMLERRLAGPLRLERVSYLEPDSGMPVLRDATAVWRPGRPAAVLGPVGSGRTELALLAAGLLPPGGGRIAIGEEDLSALPHGLLGRRIGLVGQDPHLVAGSIVDNLLYALRRVPPQPPGPEVRHRMMDIVRGIGLEDDLLAFGLAARTDFDTQADLTGGILRARAIMARTLASCRDPGVAALVEPFDPDRYLVNATVAENILFGVPLDPAFEPPRIARRSEVRRVLAQAGLEQPFFDLGVTIARTLLELFGGLRRSQIGHAGFDLGEDEDADRTAQAVRALDAMKQAEPAPADADLLRGLTFQLVRARDRLNLLDEGVRTRILTARHVFAKLGPVPGVARFDPASCSMRATIRDNILFGRPVIGRGGADRLDALVTAAVDEAGLRDAILSVGLRTDVGIAGARLSPTQRRQVAVARALMKDPDVLLLDGVLAGVPKLRQQAIGAVVETCMAGRVVVWLAGDPAETGRVSEAWTIEAGTLTGPEAVAGRDKEPAVQASRG